MARLIILLAVAGALWWWWRRRPTGASAARLSLPLLGVALLALAYVASPIDLLPDVSPLGLLDDLIVIGTTLWWLRAQWQRRPRPTARRDAPRPSSPPPADGWDPYRVLDLPRGASPDEITRAYREQMKRYHPDKVTGLGDELQEVAHRRTLEIQRAYEELSRAPRS